MTMAQSRRCMSDAEMTAEPPEEDEPHDLGCHDGNVGHRPVARAFGFFVHRTTFDPSHASRNARSSGDKARPLVSAGISSSRGSSWTLIVTGSENPRRRITA